MNIPPRLQIFDAPVVITDKDRERLSPHLGHWEKLHQFFMAGVNEPDLKRLIVMELMGSNREHVLTRLRMRLCRVQRKSLEEKIRRAA